MPGKLPHPQGAHSQRCQQNHQRTPPPYPIPQGQAEHNHTQKHSKKWGGRWLKEQGWLSHRPKKTKAANQEINIREEETSHPQEETSYPQGYKETFARYKKQCFQHCLKKLIESPIEAQVNWERKQEENHRLQLMRAAEWRVKSCIGFLPNLALSIHKNAQQVLGDMSPGCYLLKAANTALHDLTKRKSLPPAASSLLGLGHKFIPTPRHSSSCYEVEPSLAWIECDIGLKTFFAGQDDGSTPSKLRAKSNWRPPLPPRTIDIQVSSFLTKVHRLITKLKGKQNLTPHQ
jgi:hypothetical protein